MVMENIDNLDALPVVFDLGLIDYKVALRYQKEMFAEAKKGTFMSALIVCRHFPVITLGRMADKKNILATEQQLLDNDILIYEIERGGDVTYHGPGQIIVYPIFNLNFLKKDIHWFLRQIEAVIIELLFNIGIPARRRPGFTGVWVKDKKIASIGIAIKNWITFHGLSLNVTKDDLENFKAIKPCGMNIEMTSIEDILGIEVHVDAVKDRLISAFSKFWACQAKNDVLPASKIGGLNS